MHEKSGLDCADTGRVTLFPGRYRVVSLQRPGPTEPAERGRLLAFLCERRGRVNCLKV